MTSVKSRVGHTVKQQKHGLVALHIQVDLLGFVPDFLLFHLARVMSMARLCRPYRTNKGQVLQLRRQVEDAFDHLPVQMLPRPMTTAESRVVVSPCPRAARQV